MNMHFVLVTVLS